MVKFHPYTGSSIVLGKSLGESVTENLCFDFVPNGSYIWTITSLYFTLFHLHGQLLHFYTADGQSI